MLEISQKLLCFLFLASFASGIAMGGVYDLLSLSRLVLGFSSDQKHPRTLAGSRKKIFTALGRCLLFAEDLCFVLLCGICLLLLLYFINDGVFRFWAPMGLCCGFFVYRVTLGRLIISISERLVKLIHRLLKGLLSCLLLPIRWILGVGFKCVIAPLMRWRVQKAADRRIVKTDQQVLKFKQRAGQLLGMDIQEHTE
ncbi:MAG: hypothetical protein E7661_02590 [Ruminococcaceae bacterium]|nr:hypothetical protein [Oscillospiraceae bacterium]